MSRKQLPKEQFWKLYEKLPQELKDALGAQETGDNIRKTCEGYGIVGNLGDVVDLTGEVLLGLVLPQDFQKELIGTGIKKAIAEKVAREINRFVFYPVKSSLEQLHKMEIEVSAKVVTPEPLAAQEEVPTEKLEENRRPDTYREPLE